MEAVGLFELSISNVQIIENDQCSNATQLAINGQPVTGSTIFASDNGLNDYCEAAGNLSAPGVWYSIVGTGEMLELVTTHDFVMLPSIYTGTCSNLVCADGVDTTFFPSRPLIWSSNIGELYYILSHGAFSEVGNFQLSIVERARPENDNCADETQLEISTMAVNGSTLAASPDDVSHCGR